MEKRKKFAKLRALNRKRNYLIKALRLHAARLFLDHRLRRDFALSARKSVLFLRDDDKIGDMVVSTSLFREFKLAGYQLDVIAGENNAKIIEFNPYVNNCYVVKKDSKSRLRQARLLSSNDYDVVIDMGDEISPFHLLFLKTLNASNVVGFNKKRFNIYNKSLDYIGYSSHITERYYFLMKNLDFVSFSTDYDIHIPEAVSREVQDFFEKIPEKIKVVINPYTADPRRDMSQQQLSTLICRIKETWKDLEVILVGESSRIKKIDKISAITNPFTTLISACEIIRLADIVISPDTAVVHIAATWEKPLVSLYGHDIHGEYINSIVWGPGYNRSRQLYTQDKYHPVSTIEVDDIILKMSELMLFADNA